jgi:hypothetical protein
MLGSFLHYIQKSQIFGVNVFLLSWLCKFKFKAISIEGDERKRSKVIANKCCELPQWQMLLFESLEGGLKLNLIQTL